MVGVYNDTVDTKTAARPQYTTVPEFPRYKGARVMKDLNISSITPFMENQMQKHIEKYGNWDCGVG